MKICFLLTSLFSLTLVSLISSCAPTDGRAVQKVGVYDSRSIAIAYAESPRHDAEVKAELAKLDVRGQEDPAVYLDDEAHSIGQAAYDRGYSTEPVDDILEHIKTRLPAIKKKAGVTALVSKWDKQGMKKYAGAEQVNVTMALVVALDPIDSQLAEAEAIQDKKPSE